jgi:hypothetical protein
MPRPVESASLYPGLGKFIAGGDDMWVRLFDFDTGDELGKLLDRSLLANQRFVTCCSMSFEYVKERV